MHLNRYRHWLLYVHGSTPASRSRANCHQTSSSFRMLHWTTSSFDPPLSAVTCSSLRASSRRSIFREAIRTLQPVDRISRHSYTESVRVYKKIKSRLFIEYAAPGQAQPHQHKRCNHEPHNYEPHNHKPQNHEVYISVKGVGGNFYRGGLPGTPGEGSPAIFQFSGGCSTPIFGRFNGQTERIFGPGGLCPLANACLRL